MRVLRGEPLSRTAELLSDDQRAALQTVKDKLGSEHLRAKEEARVTRLVVLETRRAVRDARQAGVPVRLIADAMGVTRNRIYQMTAEVDHVDELNGL